MKRFWAIGLLATAGCASGVTREDHEALKRKYDDLEKKVEAYNNKQTTLYAEIVDKHDQLARRVGTVDQAIKILETSVKYIQEKLKGTSSSNQNTGKSDDPKIEDVATRTSEALLGMKTGKLQVDQVIVELKPIAKGAAPLLVEELRRAVKDLNRSNVYVNQLQAILSNLPVDAVRIPVVQALGEPGPLRMCAARIIGNLRDKDVAKELEAYANTDDEDFRLVLGESLVQCRNSNGIPLLIKCLASKDFYTCAIAIEILRRLNKNETFGYNSARPETHAEAIKKWEEWYKTIGKMVFE